MDDGNTRQRNILVVEDERDIADLAALHLCDEGFAVVIADDAHSGMREACSRSWDLVILDIRFGARRIEYLSRAAPKLRLRPDSYADLKNGKVGPSFKSGAGCGRLRE